MKLYHDSHDLDSGNPNDCPYCRITELEKEVEDLKCRSYWHDRYQNSVGTIIELRTKLAESVSQKTHNFAVRKAAEYRAKLATYEAALLKISAMRGHSERGCLAGIISKEALGVTDEK